MRLAAMDHSFGGNKISQTWNDLFIWELVLNEYPPRRILELGTFTGGMASYLHVQAMLRGAEFYTFDNMELQEIRNERKDSFYRSDWKLPFIRLDVQSEDGKAIISPIIQNTGRTVVFCDNGHKETEADIYAPILKSGDVLAIHDWGTEANRSPGILKLYEPIEGIYEELQSITRFFIK